MLRGKGYRSIQRSFCSFFDSSPSLAFRRFHSRPAAAPYHADFISILWDVSRWVTMFHRLFTTLVHPWDETRNLVSVKEMSPWICAWIASLIFAVYLSFDVLLDEEIHEVWKYTPLYHRQTEISESLSRKERL